MSFTIRRCALCDRDAFTKAFTPAIFYQSTKTDRLKPGDFRMHTEMRVHIQLNGSTTIRVPTREASKVCHHTEDVVYVLSYIDVQPDIGLELGQAWSGRPYRAKEVWMD